MKAEELTDFTIEQFNAIAEKKLTVQQTAKVLVSMVRIMTIQFPTDELKQRFLADFADEILSLSPKNGHYCTLGNSGRVVTIEEGFNENGKFYERASVAGKSLRPCYADDCPLKQNDL